MITTIKSTRKVRTTELRKSGQTELEVEVNSDDLLPDAGELLVFIVNYVRQSGRKISPGDTFPYGMWLLKFVLGTDVLEAWEYNQEATAFVPGVSLTLTYWRDQQGICNKFGAHFAPPIADRLTVIDEGVLAGFAVEGVQYPSPDHMSGWWITSDKYNGSVETLRRDHTYHITATRRDLVPYLALPFGFRFRLAEDGADVWFDEKVATERITGS